MSTARLAPALARARAAITNKWPNRDRTSDGWIGNAAHQATISDHNPDSQGVVHAIDVDRDGIHIPTVIASFVLHPITNYVIFNRRILDTDNHYKPHVYTGTNPHTRHLHASIRYGIGPENSQAAWLFLEKSPIWIRPVKLGSQGTLVNYTQAYLLGHGYCIEFDGDFGPRTLAAVKAFQKAHGLKVDGIVGPLTRKAFKTR